MNTRVSRELLWVYDLRSLSKVEKLDDLMLSDSRLGKNKGESEVATAVCNAVMVEMLAINILPELSLIWILPSSSNSTVLRVDPNPLSISPR